MTIENCSNHFNCKISW